MTREEQTRKSTKTVALHLYTEAAVHLMLQNASLFIKRKGKKQRFEGFAA